MPHAELVRLARLSNSDGSFGSDDDGGDGDGGGGSGGGGSGYDNGVVVVVEVVETQGCD